MPINIASLSQFLTFPILFKFFYLFILIVYIIFTLIIFNQVRSMSYVVSEISSGIVIKILSVIGIILAVMLFFAAIVIL